MNKNINQKIADKNRTILGRIYKAEIIKREEVEGRVITTCEEVDFELNPIPIENWKTMEATLITSFDNVQITMISLTTGKEKEWLEKFLHGDHLQPLFEACKEMNKGFFTRYQAAKAFEAEMKNLLGLKKPEEAVLSDQEKSEEPQS
jgi:hypothetical protein